MEALTRIIRTSIKKCVSRSGHQKKQNIQIYGRKSKAGLGIREAHPSTSRRTSAMSGKVLQKCPNKVIAVLMGEGFCHEHTRDFLSMGRLFPV